MATAAAGLLLFATVGPDTAYFPTIFFACFAIGLGIGNAFMPLLTLAMADVPAADAGLGSGITNVSQQISGALGLAVLSTVAANHTKGLLSDGNGLTSSLLGGYHVAFLAGAVAIGAGIVLAIALLRPRDPQLSRAAARSTASPPDSPWRNKPHDPRRFPEDPARLRRSRRLLHPRHLGTHRLRGHPGRRRADTAPEQIGSPTRVGRSGVVTACRSVSGRGARPVEGRS